jgi:hypothetical protein
MGAMAGDVVDNCLERAANLAGIVRWAEEERAEALARIANGCIEIFSLEFPKWRDMELICKVCGCLTGEPASTCR